MTLNKIMKINKGLRQKFDRTGHTPFQIMTRLLEECGELAEQINHFEDQGIKQEKLGPPDRMKLAKESQDVLRCVMQIVEYYQIEHELSQSIDLSLNALQQKDL